MIKVMSYYHVTQAHNLDSIFRTGLVPAIGQRSKACGESVARTYLFTTLDDLDNALSNWLGEEFEDEDIAVLKVESEDVVPGDVEYESVCLETIAPDCIQLERIE